jgi:hypothetical protein
VRGFVYIVSLLISMEGCLAIPPKHPWTTGRWLFSNNLEIDFVFSSTSSGNSPHYSSYSEYTHSCLAFRTGQYSSIRRFDYAMLSNYSAVFPMKLVYPILRSRLRRIPRNSTRLPSTITISSNNTSIHSMDVILKHRISLLNGSMLVKLRDVFTIFLSIVLIGKNE